ncbi:MAG: nucleotide sugar dehydrogenase [Bacteroidia bacterium]|nr:nucleotide sugar dehydrogenase [Bacteroidia bacterium]
MKNIKIGVIGLGYVGLPLAVELGKKYPTIGFDIDEARVKELNDGYDRTKEMDKDQLQDSGQLNLSCKLDDLKSCNFYIVTVPTPIDHNKKPDLRPLISASTTIGKVLKKDDIVVYESTVYPGCTEEDCVPVLEKHSNLKYNVDFYCGYSPERIVPGDKERTLTKIRKITSGSTPEIAKIVDDLYASIIVAGTYQAASIRVAEAAKVIENCQRDLNISFVNELALIFDKMGIDTNDVIEAAGTKFNFIKYKPGLVGGHCISVDPYYLTSKAESLGYYPQVIHSGRRINDNMAAFVANKVIKLLIQKSQPVKGAKVLVLGITFKENCPDLRNSKVIDVINEMKEFGCEVSCFDPNADKSEVMHEYNLSLIEKPEGKYHAIVHAVSHEQFKSIDLKGLMVTNGALFDVKSSLDRDLVDGRL